MNFNDDLRAADAVLDHRLYAAGNALREASATQVDTASSLRVILLNADPMPEEPHQQLALSPSSPATSLLRRPRRRLALAVNLLLLLALGVGFLVGVERGKDLGHLTQVPTPQRQHGCPLKHPAVRARTVASVPEQCVETAELADEVISRLNKNIRDERLFLALRDFTIASQACRREASP
jgi:hypothetical protein